MSADQNTVNQQVYLRLKSIIKNLNETYYIAARDDCTMAAQDKDRLRLAALEINDTIERMCAIDPSAGNPKYPTSPPLIKRIVKAIFDVP